MRLLFFAWLLTLPGACQGWFDTLTMEVRPQHSGVEELRVIISTIVPDADYEASGDRLLVRGESGTLSLVRDFVAELDRPLDRVLVDLCAREVSQELWELISGAPNRTNLKMMSRFGTDENSRLWISSWADVHPKPERPNNSGEAKVLTHPHVVAPLGVEAAIEIPEETATKLFRRSGVVLNVHVEAASTELLLIKISFEADDCKWLGRVEVGDGTTLIVSGNEEKMVVFITSSLMR